ncbi:hypothetical protein J7J13_00190 [bacterium]|nr:hypothetical protein [bacterium]
MILSPSLFAAPPCDEQGVILTNGIDYFNSDRVLIRIGTLNNPEGCAKNTYMHLDRSGTILTSTQSQDILSSLEIAKGEGQTVCFITSGCSNLGHPIIVRIAK